MSDDTSATEVEQDQQEPEDVENTEATEELGEAGEKALEAFKARARKAERDNRKLADRVKEFEDAQKTDQEKAAEELATFKSRAETAEAKLLRYKVAAEKQLPPELAERLQGKDEAELGDDADRLLALVKPNGKPAGDADAGKGVATVGESFNDLLRR
jgi:hypothetical protein